MKVRLKTTITGTRNGVDWPPPGEVVDLPGTEAMDLCTNGLADPVREDKVENAKAKQDDVEEREAPKVEKKQPLKATKRQPPKAKS